MSRYQDEDYDRRPRPAGHRETRERDPRDARDRDPREIRTRGEPTRESRRIIESDRMDVREDRMDAAMDTRMDPRIDPRASAAARLDPRPDRGMERTREPEVLIYRDPRTGELYREPPSRSPFTREDRDEIPADRRRPIIDPMPARDREDAARPDYNEYFLPGEGIDREVIQHEICRYLGQDATCRPYRHADGRQGYLVRAYRTFTTAMISSLKDDTMRWRMERQKRARQGRAEGSYADMRDRQDRRNYGDSMEIDDEYAPPPSRHREPEPRGVVPTSRHASTAVSTGYPPEPGYPAYSLSSAQPGIYGPESQPRTYGGGSTPPNMGRSAQPVYGDSGYPSRTSAAAPSIPVTTFRDPRTGQPMQYAPPGYPADTGRHSRR